MENHELPKNLTPEEIELQKKNLEQKAEDKIEIPQAEDPNIRLSSINETLDKKNENIKNTQNEINKIRGELGLPPTEEIPPSIKSDQDSIAKLNQEKSELEHKNKISDVNQESQVEDTKKFEGNLRTAMEDITGKSKMILDALDERHQNNLTPLIKREDFFAMASSFKNLKNIESKIDINSITNIIDNINRLSQLFNTFSIQGNSVRESNQSLERLADSAKRFTSSVNEDSRKLPIEMQDKEMEEKSKELRNSLQKLSEQSEKLWLFAVKLRENAR